MSALISQAKSRIKNDEFEFLFWRAILGKALTYNEACNSDLQAVIDANAVLDLKAEQERNESEKLKLKGGR